MNTTDAGRLGEAKALAKLTEYGWYPFTDISGKCPVDIIAWKDGQTKTFQVKATASTARSGKYVVQVGSTRPNRTGNTIHKFTADSCDYLVVYIIPEDRVYFIPSEEVKVGRELTLDDKHEVYLELED